jgi:hypothetical protein
VLPSSFLDQFSNSRSDKEDGKGSSQTREGGSDFLILDTSTAPNPILEDGVKSAAQYQP